MGSDTGEPSIASNGLLRGVELYVSPSEITDKAVCGMWLYSTDSIDGDVCECSLVTRCIDPELLALASLSGDLGEEGPA